MTVAPKSDVEDLCLQLFTWRYGKFTFGNDTVTASDLDRCPSMHSRSKRYQPPAEKVAGNRHAGCRGYRCRHKNLNAG